MRAGPLVVLSCLALALLAAATPSAAAAAQAITLDAVADEREFYFLRDGARNPDIAVAPGDVVTITLHVDEGPHNIAIAPPVAERTNVTGNETQTLAFTVPADATGRIAYWCEPHREWGMAGALVVNGGDDADTPALAALAVVAAGGLAAAALARGRR